MPTPVSTKTPVILQLLPSLRSGGVERGTLDMARAIRQAGWQAIVASQGGPMASSLPHFGANHITLPLASKNPLTMWANAGRIARIIERHKVDIVHARSRAPAWSAYLAAQRTNRPFITTFHGVYGLENKWKRKYNAIMTRGERVIAISDFIAEHIKTNYAVAESRIRIIPRGVDLKLFNPFSHSPQRMIQLTKEWRLPDDMPVILFPGRVTRWKGQDVFLRALAQLSHRHFFAVILGDDKGHETYRHELEALITELGLEGHVRIARHTGYISEAYMLAKLVVATSTEPEAFGRVPLEAQAMGKPVIATNHGGARETVLPETTGWLVEPGDVDQLATAMERALTLDEETLRTMGERAMANADRFSLQQMCEKTLAVYSELLG